MLKTIGWLRRLLILGLAVALVLTAGLSYAAWDVYFATDDYGLDFQIGEFDPIGGVPPIDRLPANTPDYVLDQLGELEKQYPEDMINALVDAIIGIADDDYFGEYNNLLLGATPEDIFNAPGFGGVSSDDMLIYTVTENGVTEFVIIHISPDRANPINTLEELERALANPWEHANLISNVWIAGNLYNTFNAPIEHGVDSSGNPRYFLLMHNGPAGTPPPAGEWFEVTENFRWVSSNSYFSGYIVSHNGNHFRSRWQNSGQQPDPSNQWGSWELIPDYSSSASYPSGSLARTQENGEYRFWQALSGASGVAPSAASARAGNWRQLSNGWIGRSGDNTIKYYYHDHNTYSSGDIVIFGMSVKMRYRYFRARGAVPADQPPLINVDGVTQLNSAYWEAWT